MNAESTKTPLLSDAERKARIEALKLLSEWGKWLTSIQVISGAVMASSLQDGNLAESLRESHWVVAGVVFLLISLTAAISLVGSIPGALIVEANDKTRPATIYRHKLWKTVPFWLLASLEHIFFLAAVLCFAVAALE